MSQYNTFDVYQFVGFDMDRFYYGQGRLTGVFDSGIASMMAENGFIGVLLIALLIYYYFRFFKSIFNKYNYMIFKILTWFTIALSFTEPNWQNGLYTTFYTINVLLIYTKNEKEKLASEN